MKHVLLSILILLCLRGYTQNKADAIKGRWLRIPKEDMIVEVFKSGNEYIGKITWTKQSANKMTTGFVILEKLKYNSKNNEWEYGKIHDPGSGNTYDAQARIRSDGTLELHAFKGIKLIGTKKYFKRATSGSSVSFSPFGKNP